ncbi:MAG TPA: LuxR C-terminal-related transcriptional regulator [Acidimicrobiales bacterium]|nr:LuxR C-terminal-related transcriptional regulator [Acidimicrobiales bacterium]
MSAMAEATVLARVAVECRRLTVGGRCRHGEEEHLLDELVRAVQRVGTGQATTAAGAPPTHTTPQERGIASEALASLTPREVEVVHLLCRGRSRVELAEELGISAATARNHLNSILRKTGTESGLEAVAFARREGLVREPGAPPLS